MSVLGKLAFWKKNDEFSDLDVDKELGNFNQQGLSSGMQDFDRQSTLGLQNPPFSPSEEEMNSSINLSSTPQFATSAAQRQSSFPQASSPYQQSGYAQQQSPYAQRMPEPVSMKDTASDMQHPHLHEKNFEILSSKLDSIRATLMNVEQRLANLERIAEDSQQGSNPSRRRVW